MAKGKDKKTKLDESPDKQGLNRGDNFDEKGNFKEGHSIGEEFRFKEGESGNPNGRPRKFRIKEILGDMVDEVVSVTEKDSEGKVIKTSNMTVMEAMLRKIVKKAIGGDKWSIGFIADRTEGRPVQPIAEDAENLLQFLWGEEQPEEQQRIIDAEKTE